MRINNVYIFQSPSFGVRKTLEVALKDGANLPSLPMITSLIFSKEGGCVAAFQAEHILHINGNVKTRLFAGTIYVYSSFDAGEHIATYMDVQYDEV